MKARVETGRIDALRLRRAALAAVFAAAVLLGGAAQAFAKANPTIHWGTPPPVTYGTALNANLLNAWVSGGLAGTFVYSPAAGAVLGAGTHTLSVTFNPNDTADYNSVSTTVQLTVNKAQLTVAAFNVSALTWSDAIPALRYAIANFVSGENSSVVSGAPVIATTAVQGSPVGQYPITVSIGTLSAANYSFNLVPATLNITPAPLFVHAYNVYGMDYGDPLPNFEYSIVGFRDGQTQSVVTGAPSIATTATRTSHPGTYPITPTLGTLSAPNYTFQFFPATLTIVKATPVITWPAPAPVYYPTALSSAQLDARAYVPGSISYSPAAGDDPPPGTDTLTATFTPTDTTDYKAVTATVQLTVNGSGAVTTTALAVTSGGSTATSVTSGAVVTLTATVEAGSTPVTAGSVKFCNAAAPHCTDINIVGIAQLTSAGTATVKFRPGVGSHSYQAVFTGIKGDEASISSAEPLTVSGKYPSAIGVEQQGTDSPYGFYATVGGNDAGHAPTGMVKFLDASNGDALLGTATLENNNPHAENFINAPNLATGAYPDSVAAADFNGDGIPDLVVANQDSGTLSVFLGNGDGTFTPGPNVTSYLPEFVTVGDFNGDGIPDLVVGERFPSDGFDYVFVYLGRGDGTFSLKSNTLNGDTAAAAPAVVVGDFNGDGIQDLAMVFGESCGGLGEQDLEILIGDGDGTFKAAAIGPVLEYCPVAIAAGDFNGDGFLDLAVVNQGSNAVAILLGNGDGTFTQTAASPPTDPYPVSIAVGDFNGDGNLDLAVAAGTEACCNGMVTILLGDGTGGFTPTVDSLTMSAVDGEYPLDIAVGDFNGDGVADLVVATQSQWILIYQGVGDGTFHGEEGAGTADYYYQVTGSQSDSISVADFNGDGFSDVAATHPYANTVTVSEAANWFRYGILGSVSIPITHKVIATYSGDSNYRPSVSGPAVPSQ